MAMMISYLLPIQGPDIKTFNLFNYKNCQSVCVRIALVLLPSRTLWILFPWFSPAHTQSFKFSSPSMAKSNVGSEHSPVSAPAPEPAPVLAPAPESTPVPEPTTESIQAPESTPALEPQPLSLLQSLPQSSARSLLQSLPRNPVRSSLQSPPQSSLITDTEALLSSLVTATESDPSSLFTGFPGVSFVCSDVVAFCATLDTGPSAGSSCPLLHPGFFLLPLPHGKLCFGASVISSWGVGGFGGFCHKYTSPQ